MELSDHFGTSKLDEPNLDETVENIHLCGYANENNGGDKDGRPPTNHWTIFLQTIHQRSVKVDMIPGDGEDGLQGYILLESKKYAMTNKGIKSVTFAPMNRLPVKDVITIIMANGRDRYMFTEDEEGCRFWICTVVKDLEDAKKIVEGSEAVARHTLSYYWEFPTGSTPRKMESGTFF